MKERIGFYLERRQIIKDGEAVRLSKKYLEKAKNSLITTKILSEINTNKNVRDVLRVPKDYDSDEWVVVCGYYAMYTAALALLAKIGFRSKNHAATLAILEEYFVKKKRLTDEDLLLIKNAQFQKEEIEKISEARQKREIAQYSVTKQTTKEIAEKIKKDAYSFVGKVEEILET